MRLFVAIVPPPEVVDSLAHFLAPRWEAGPELRWTTPEQWHLTLAFMGAAPERTLDELVDRLERAGRRRWPMELQLGGAGVFPNVYDAKVLYTSTTVIDEVDIELRRLARGVRAAAGKAGAAPSGGRFTPHVTLARSNHPFEATRWIRIVDAWQSLPWIADEFVLIESVLGQGEHGRPLYREVARFGIG